MLRRSPAVVGRRRGGGADGADRGNRARPRSLADLPSTESGGDHHHADDEELDEQPPAVGAVGDRVEAVELTPGVDHAGEGEGDHRPERDGREPGHGRPEPVTADDGDDGDDPADPDRHRGEVDQRREEPDGDGAARDRVAPGGDDREQQQPVCAGGDDERSSVEDATGEPPPAAERAPAGRGGQNHQRPARDSTTETQPSGSSGPSPRIAAWAPIITAVPIAPISPATVSSSRVRLVASSVGAHMARTANPPTRTATPA